MLEVGMKRFLITLGLSILVWLASTFIQAMLSYKVSFSLFGSSCQITGFPIAKCLYDSDGQVPAKAIVLINILIWFWGIHLFWKLFDRRGMSSKK